MRRVEGNQSVGVAKDFIWLQPATSGDSPSQWFVLLLDSSDVIGARLQNQNNGSTKNDWHHVIVKSNNNNNNDYLYT